MAAGPPRDRIARVALAGALVSWALFQVTPARLLDTANQLEVHEAMLFRIESLADHGDCEGLTDHAEQAAADRNGKLLEYLQRKMESSGCDT